MLKASRYNIYDEKNFSYIANALTGSCIQVTKKEILRVKSGKFSEFSEEELIILQENGIVVDSELDEVQLLRNAYNFCKYTNKKATITIVPSLACNFDCEYCYENKNNECMNEEIQKQALIFLQSLLMDNHISEINVCWYGGEPLLHMEILKKLSMELIAFCNEKGIEYHASIITNGYLVDHKVIDTFKCYAIKTAQITIDGTKETHNIRRKLINGGETYERVKSAIFFLAENDINVVVRVNLDKSNVHEYKNVYDVFAEKERIKCYPAIVTIEDSQSLFQKSLCYTHIEFEKFYDVIFKEMYEDGEREFDISIQPEINHCAAEHVYSYVIAPDGYLYKCLNDICDNKYAVGHVSEESSGTVITAKYLGRDPFTEPECEKCPYIPVCYGGCIYEYRKHNTHACKAGKFMYKKYYQKEIGGEVMKVVNKKKNSHMDYANMAKSSKLTENSGKPCNQRDLPCGQNTR